MNDAASIIATAACTAILAFIAGHMVGFWRGKGRVTCPLCHGSGAVPAYGPIIKNEKEALDAGGRAGKQWRVGEDGPPVGEGRSTSIDTPRADVHDSPLVVPVCPYCGDGMNSIGTLNHIECVRALMGRVAELEGELADAAKG